jgi:DNA integrity scanning protein DisA with diadenylate cyclase activity
MLAQSVRRFAAKDNDVATAVFDTIRRQLTWCRRDVLRELLDLAIEIAREGREGRRIGTLFTLGEADRVLAQSHPLIHDPLAGHVPDGTSVFDENARGTIKELAQLDGAFVVSADGVVCSACRYLDTTAEGIELRLGLGTRHLAAASVSKRLGVVAIVVSESAVVRVFCQGSLIAELIPELWLFRRYLQRLPSGKKTRGQRQGRRSARSSSK